MGRDAFTDNVAEAELHVTYSEGMSGLQDI